MTLVCGRDAGAGGGVGDVVVARGLRCSVRRLGQGPLMGWGGQLAPVIGPEMQESGRVTKSGKMPVTELVAMDAVGGSGALCGPVAFCCEFSLSPACMPSRSQGPRLSVGHPSPSAWLSGAPAQAARCGEWQGQPRSTL